jgi:hypothetical protein
MNTFASPLIACAGLFHEISVINMPSTMDILAKIYEELYPIAVRMEPILRRMTDRRMTVPRNWFDLVRSMRHAIGTDGTLLPGEGPQVLEPNVCFAGAFQLMTEMRNRNQARSLLSQPLL